MTNRPDARREIRRPESELECDSEAMDYLVELWTDYIVLRLLPTNSPACELHAAKYA